MGPRGLSLMATAAREQIEALPEDAQGEPATSFWNVVLVKGIQLQMEEGSKGKEGLVRQLLRTVAGHVVPIIIKSIINYLSRAALSAIGSKLRKLPLAKAAAARLGITLSSPKQPESQATTSLERPQDGEEPLPSQDLGTVCRSCQQAESTTRKRAVAEDAEQPAGKRIAMEKADPTDSAATSPSSSSVDVSSTSSPSRPVMEDEPSFRALTSHISYVAHASAALPMDMQMGLAHALYRTYHTLVDNNFARRLAEEDEESAATSTPSSATEELPTNLILLPTIGVGSSEDTLSSTSTSHSSTVSNTHHASPATGASIRDCHPDDTDLDSPAAPQHVDHQSATFETTAASTTVSSSSGMTTLNPVLAVGSTAPAEQRSVQSEGAGADPQASA